MAFYHTDRDGAKHWPAWWQVAGGKLQVPRGKSSPTCNLHLATCHQVQRCFDKYFQSLYNLCTVIVPRRQPIDGQTADPINE